MKSFRNSILVALALALRFAPAPACAHSPAGEMADAANNFLAALPAEQRAKAVFEFQTDERVNWHFVPRARKGLPFAEMSPAQKHLAHVLLSTPLSHAGYFKAATIMSLEDVLHGIEQGRGPARDAEMYYVSVFGTPGKDVWGFRIEGHHLALNFTLRGDAVLATTPSFLGSNPAEVKDGPRKGLRVLASEEDLARQLVKSLDAADRYLAVIATNAPRDILTGDSRKATRLEPAGLSAGRMNSHQQDLLKKLIKEYLERNRSEVADADWAKIERMGWRNVFFAWAGGLEPGEGHYYRVQSPMFLFEYDNTQNNANHVHAVWRNFENDFGDDLLKQHYEQAHPKQGQ